jgi:hypothetical protein
MNTQLVNMVFSPYHRSKLLSLSEAIEFLWKEGVINVGELAEKAIVKKNKKLTQNSKGAKGSDFDDKSDSKYTTVAYLGGSAYATINGFKNKIGTLRVVVYEPKTKKNYFFKIPYKFYSKYQNGNTTLKVFFDNSGTPRVPKRKGTKRNLWLHECSADQWAK